MKIVESSFSKWKVAVIIEIGGSLLMLVCLFFPWIVASFQGMDNSASVSLINDALIKDLVRWLNTYLRDWIGDYGMIKFNYGYLLFLFPVLCAMNPLIQYFIRLPWLTFYTAVFAAVTVLVACVFVKECVNRGSGGIVDGDLGFGAILVAIISAIMMISSWICIGWNYKKHWIYLVIVLIWCVISYVCLDDVEGVAFSIFLLLGAVQIPFLIFAFLISLCSWFVHTRKNKLYLHGK